MAYSFNGTNQYLSIASAIITGAPFTYAGYFYANTTNAASTLAIVSIADNTSSASFTMLGCAGFATGDPIQMSVASSGGNFPASTTTGFSASTWQHAAGTASSTTSRSAFINGGSKGSDTTSVTPTGLNRTAIGAMIRTAVAQYMDGRIAEAAIWNVALSDAEIASLGKGFKPYRVRPQSLQFYAPLIREVRDWRKGVSITNNNAATVADHPRVY